MCLCTYVGDRIGLKYALELACASEGAYAPIDVDLQAQWRFQTYLVKSISKLTFGSPLKNQNYATAIDVLGFAGFPNIALNLFKSGFLFFP